MKLEWHPNKPRPKIAAEIGEALDQGSIGPTVQ